MSGTSKGVEGVTFPSSRAAVIVAILKVEPGSKVSTTGRLRSSSGFSSARLLGLKRGTLAMARIEPSRGSITTAIALRAPYFSRVSASTLSTWAWMAGFRVSWTSAPRWASRSASVWMGRPKTSRTSRRRPGVPVSGLSACFSMPDRPAPPSPVRPITWAASGPPGTKRW